MVRVATFNCENLFARYNFKLGAVPQSPEGFTINELAFNENGDGIKQGLTAMTLREVDADIVCLQETDSLNALDFFTSKYLGGLKYYHKVLIDSHDPRHIDVSILSRHPLVSLRTHRNERNAKGNDWKFSRDCLEVDVDVNGKTLTLYINHFKSMVGGRPATKAKRVEQSGRVKELIEERWQATGFMGNFIALGDFNDYISPGNGIDALVTHPGVENVLDRLPVADRWTHYFAGGDEYKQLDYLLLSKQLAQANAGLPEVMRMGMAFRATRYTGARFNGVGFDNPKASDHAPLYMDVTLV